MQLPQDGGLSHGHGHGHDHGHGHGHGHGRGHGMIIFAIKREVNEPIHPRLPLPYVDTCTCDRVSPAQLRANASGREYNSCKNKAFKALFCDAKAALLQC